MKYRRVKGYNDAFVSSIKISKGEEFEIIKESDHIGISQIGSFVREKIKKDGFQNK